MIYIFSYISRNVPSLTIIVCGLVTLHLREIVYKSEEAFDNHDIANANDEFSNKE